jgi:hypothetical protein
MAKVFAQSTVSDFRKLLIFLLLMDIIGRRYLRKFVQKRNMQKIAQ